MSAIYNEIPKLNFEQSTLAVAACAAGGRTGILMGAPGIGKSALAKVVAEAFGLPLVTTILSNCFGRETAFITNAGVKTFEDFQDGDSTMVLTHTGAWKNAVVRNHGVQPLHTIRFGRQANSQSVRATRSHTWLLENGQRTKTLEAGQKLMKPPHLLRDWAYDEAPEGQKRFWILGFIYGDGTPARNGEKAYGSHTRLCGAKARFVSRFEELGYSVTYPPSSNGEPNVYLKGVYKHLPDPKEIGFENTMAFVRGFLDADGSRNTRHPETSDINPFQGIQVTGTETIDFVRKVFPMVGAYVVNEDVRTDQATQYGARTAETVYFSLVLGFSNSPVSAYIAREISEETTNEEVWCLSVEDDHSFVLPCGIVTGNCDPTDIAGLPMLNPETNKVAMHPFPEFRQAIETASVLFVDEFTAIRKSVEAPAMRLMLESYAGGQRLHEGTKIIGACNAPEHAPGGIEISAAMLNRVIWLRYEPSFSDISDYFGAAARGGSPENVGRALRAVRGLLGYNKATQEAYNKSKAMEMMDWGATASVQPDLINLEPPADAINAGKPWASPRAWEAGISAYAALGRDPVSGYTIDKSGKGSGDLIGFAILAGAVGPHAASAYLAIRDLRTKLPAVKDIVDNPENAKLPTKELSIAVLGVVTRVAHEDFGSACIYMERMAPEFSAAIYRQISKLAPTANKSKWGSKKAVESFSRLSRKIGEAV